MRRAALMLAAVLGSGALPACGGGETPAETVEQTPAAVEATPEPTPEATPAEVLDPVVVFHLVLDEVVAPPGTPSRSPLARRLAPLPEGIPDSAFLEDDRAARAAVEGMRTLEAGYGASGEQLVLVQWNLRWGEDAAAGETRRWGLCHLPCTVEDSFLATPAHFPVGVLTGPRALFALRPGVSDLAIALDDAGLTVSHGDAALWAAGEPGEPIVGSEPVEVSWLEADGLTPGSAKLTATRSLVARSVESRQIAVESSSDPVDPKIRLLPRLGAAPDAPRRLVVEGVPELWPWPEAADFEGGFSAKPNPDNDGLRLSRAARQITWTPTVRQAGDGVAEFPTYGLSGEFGRVTVAPFPDGAVVLGGTRAVDGRVVVAAGTDFEPERRARQIADTLEHFASLLPLPETADGEPSFVVYSVKDSTGVVPGSAGPRSVALTVEDDLDELDTIARAWASLVLGPRMASDGVAARDFLAWAMARIEAEPADRSILMHSFIAAGDDVEGVWRDWLRDPAREEPDPGEFLKFVDGQLPELAEQLRRDLVGRRFVVEPSPEPIEPATGATGISASLTDEGPLGGFVLVRLPPGAELEEVQVKVAPKKGEPHWSAALIAERYWEEAETSFTAKADLLGRLAATQGIPDEEEVVEATPAPPPSQLRGQYAGSRVVERPKKAGAAELTLRHDEHQVGRSIVLVTVWGAPGWRADVSVTSPVAMPAEPAEPSADAPPPAPEEKDDGEGEAPAGQESQ